MRTLLELILGYRILLKKYGRKAADGWLAHIDIPNQVDYMIKQCVDSNGDFIKTGLLNDQDWSI